MTGLSASSNAGCPTTWSDLQISDTQMSLLMGLSFAIFYTVLGVPIGRLADSRSRRGIIAAGIALWSLMTAACGVAKTYAQLLLTRVGVGVGEAALSPPAYSLIADYFPRDRLAMAVSIYSMGIYIGSGLALLLGGAILGVVSAEGVWHAPLIGSSTRGRQCSCWWDCRACSSPCSCAPCAKCRGAAESGSGPAEPASVKSSSTCGATSACTRRTISASRCGC